MTRMTGRCLVCADALSAPIVWCAACDTPSHEQCFGYTGRCAVYGCASVASSPSRGAPATPPPAAPPAQVRPPAVHPPAPVVHVEPPGHDFSNWNRAATLGAVVVALAGAREVALACVLLAYFLIIMNNAGRSAAPPE